NVAELVRLNSNPGSERMPVRFSAVITYYDPTSHAVYLQDQTGGVCLDVGQKNFSQRAGDSVEVTGFATGSGTRTVISLEDLAFTPAGQFEMPQPAELKVRDVEDANVPANWVLLRGVVRYAGINNNR